MPIEINLKARCLSPNRPSEAATARLFFNCKVTDETYSEIQHLTRNYSGDTADFRFFIDKMHKTTKNEVFYVATLLLLFSLLVTQIHGECEIRYDKTPVEINLKARCLSPNRASDAATARILFNCKDPDETNIQLQNLTQNYSGDTADFPFYLKKMPYSTKTGASYVATIDHQCTRHNRMLKASGRDCDGSGATALSGSKQGARARAGNFESGSGSRAQSRS
ncbi:unnamed protein product [Bursaphelenchus xylophilus]|uniref:(pine wood nematode) hypothetical protein n=1 Tax=Bursaphelenchus xylophilus TaxID=6326 RepID=A0A7I8WYM3_BURXY|nr:unnamed protein product [Bursaphelenchus xylophilus]CAG9101582.1 unnamed protein product [Bursaphelenchus xylophilus]